MKAGKRAIKSVVAALAVASMVAVSGARAEFLKTGAGVYQSTGRQAKVIISQEQPGIFLIFGSAIDLQVFNPAELPKEGGPAHAFIRFDPKINRYTAVIIGRREYRISGSFTLNLGKLRVTVDNNNPYLSIVHEQDGAQQQEPEILGLLGLSVIVNNTGQQAVALLEANQFSQYKGIVNPYEVKEGQLVVNGKPVNAAGVGVALEIKNACLQSGAVVLTHEAFDTARQAKGKDEVRQILERALSDSKNRPPLQGLLKLRITPESIIALDPINGTVRVVKRVTLASPTSAPVCSLEEIRFGM